jgi:hypothetical protein
VKHNVDKPYCIGLKPCIAGILAAACLAMLGQPEACAQPRAAPEYQLKAAFLYNLLQFIEWPDDTFKDAATPLTICIFDPQACGSSFDAYWQNTVNGRKLLFKHCAKLQDSSAGDVLFLNSQDRKVVQEMLDAVRGRPILTVGEVVGFAQMGGIINFYSMDNKLRFEINPRAAKRAGLKLSSEILKVARIAHEK